MKQFENLRYVAHEKRVIDGKKERTEFTFPPHEKEIHQFLLFGNPFKVESTKIAFSEYTIGIANYFTIGIQFITDYEVTSKRIKDVYNFPISYLESFEQEKTSEGLRVVIKRKDGLIIKSVFQDHKADANQKILIDELNKLIDLLE
jgi:hypothetical protein